MVPDKLHIKPTVLSKASTFLQGNKPKYPDGKYMTVTQDNTDASGGYSLQSNRAKDVNEMMLEAYRGKLYHATTPEGATQAITQNTLKVSPQFVGISLTRNPNFWYKYTLHPIRFILDGNRLSQNYKVEPYNYAQDPRGIVKEAEEVVKTDIRNLNRYLIGIEVSKHGAPPGAVEWLEKNAGVPVFYHGRIPPMAREREHEQWPNQRYSSVIPPRAVDAHRWRRGL